MTWHHGIAGVYRPNVVVRSPGPAHSAVPVAVPDFTVDCSTIGAAGDYLTLTAWQTAEATDLIAANKIACAQMLDEVHTDSVVLNDAAWVTDATRYIWIDSAVGAKHDGTTGSGARLIVDDSANAIQCDLTNGDVHVTNLEISSTDASRARGIFVSATTDLSVDNCIIHGFDLNTGWGIEVDDSSSGPAGNFTVVNTMIFDCATAGIATEQTGDSQTWLLYNNSIWCDDPGSLGAIALSIVNAADGSDRDVDLRNCLLHGSDVALFTTNNVAATWNASSDQNIVSDTSATTTVLAGDTTESATFQQGTGGSGVRVMFESLSTSAGTDLRIVLPATPADNAAIGFGNNLTGITVPDRIFIAVDITGEARPSAASWDVGCDQLAAVGAGGRGGQSRRGRRGARGRKPNIIDVMRAKDRATEEIMKEIRKRLVESY